MKLSVVSILFPHERINSPLHGAPGPGQRRMADVDVALDGQCQRQPNGSRVEECRYDFFHVMICVAGEERSQWPVVVAESVEVKEPRSREEERQHIAEGHSHEDEVGRRPHVLLGQDEDDERVDDDGDEDQDGHDASVQGQSVADVQIGRYVQVTPGTVEHVAQIEPSGCRCGRFDVRLVRVVFPIVHEKVAGPVARHGVVAPRADLVVFFYHHLPTLSFLLLFCFFFSISAVNKEVSVKKRESFFNFKWRSI